MGIPLKANCKYTDGVVGLVQVRSLRIVSCSSLVDSTDSVLILIVLHQAGYFLPGVSDGALHNLDKKRMLWCLKMPVLPLFN